MDYRQDLQYRSSIISQKSLAESGSWDFLRQTKAIWEYKVSSFKIHIFVSGEVKEERDSGAPDAGRSPMPIPKDARARVVWASSLQQKM